MRKSFKLWVGAVAIQALLRFWVGPWVQARFGDMTGNFLFVFFRMGVVVALPLLLAWKCGFVRFRAISALALATAVDSVVLPLVQVVLELHTSPKGVVFEYFAAYMFNLPIVIIMGWVGFEIGRRLQGTTRAQT